MHEAAKQGRKDIVALLLKNGGNVNLKDGYGVTPLGVAAEYGHCDVLEHLIHKGMYLIRKDLHGHTSYLVAGVF